MPSNYRPSYKGVGEMLRSEFMQAAMKERGERVRAQAIATAPVYPYDKTHYKDSFLPVETGAHGGRHRDRAYARVVNDNSAAAIVEYGMILKDATVHEDGTVADDATVRVPEHATLRKALDAAAGF